MNENWFVDNGELITQAMHKTMFISGSGPRSASA